MSLNITRFEVLCLLETFLDSNSLSDGDNLEVLKYNLIGVDNPIYCRFSYAGNWELVK